MFNLQNQVRSGNLEPSQLMDDDITTGIKSTMKALGQNSPTTMSSLWTVDIVSDADGGL